MENGIYKMKKEKIYFIKESDLKNLRDFAKKVKELQFEKESLNEKFAHLKDKYLRLLAEFDNYRKRVEREKEEILKYGNENIILQLIPFDEIFENVLKQMEKINSDQNIKKGLELLKKEFTKLLETFGVKKISSVGEKFDPRFHEAIGFIEIEDKEDGIIIEEEKSGYIYNDRVIKPALVKIVKNKNVGKSTSEN
jgi:molecular chaperone GrpE